MPTYDYECLECKRVLEITHSINDPSIEHQKHIKRGGIGESCDGRLRRLISTRTSFRFKGGAPTPKNYV